MAKRKQCLAFVETTQAQCKKFAIPGSKYCWSHHAKKPFFLSLLIGALISLGLSESWHAMFPSTEYRELMDLKASAGKRAVFKVFLNGSLVLNQSAKVIQANSDSTELKFSIQNVGSLPASEIFTCVTYPNSLANVAPIGWQKQPSLDVYDGDHLESQNEYVHYAYESKSIVDTGNGLSFPPIRVYGSKGASIPISLSVSSPNSDKLVMQVKITVKK